MPFVVGNCHSVFILDTCTLRLSIIRFNCQFPMVVLFLCIIKFWYLKKLERDERIVIQVSDMTQGPLVIFRSYLNYWKSKTKIPVFILYAIRFPVVEIAQLASLWCDNLYSSNSYSFIVYKAACDTRKTLIFVFCRTLL